MNGHPIGVLSNGLDPARMRLAKTTVPKTTLPVSKVPVVLHEPAILAGYRVSYQPWSYYFLSLFQLHNETVNVWSHMIGCLIIIYKLYGYFHEFDIETDNVLKVLLVFGIASVICLLTSTSAHLIHNKSPYIHFVAFSIDFIGATMGGYGAGFAAFYGMSDENFYRSWTFYYLPLLSLTSYFNFLNILIVKLIYGHDPHSMIRKYMTVSSMVVQAIVNLLPFLPRYLKCPYDETCSMTPLYEFTTILIVYVLAALTFAVHQPEKTWPGQFDIIGHGHQWFHLLIATCCILIMNMIYSEHEAGRGKHAEPDLVVSLGAMMAVFVLDLITLWLLSPWIPASLKKIEKTGHEIDKSD